MDWDPSVKSIATFPDVLAMMDEKLDWTQKLGDAFLAQQAEVMAAVQRLRAKANAEGTLMSTKEQTVTVEPAPPPAAAAADPAAAPAAAAAAAPATQTTTIIKIEPADPEIVYVPTYNPTVVYGAWPYPAYPPYYYYPPMYPPGAAFFSFTAGVIIGGAFWGNCNWGSSDIDINVNRNTNINTGGNRNNVGNNAGNRGGAGNSAPASTRGGAGNNAAAPATTQPAAASGTTTRAIARARSTAIPRHKTSTAGARARTTCSRANSSAAARNRAGRISRQAALLGISPAISSAAAIGRARNRPAANRAGGGAAAGTQPAGGNRAGGGAAAGTRPTQRLDGESQLDLSRLGSVPQLEQRELYAFGKPARLLEPKLRRLLRRRHVPRRRRHARRRGPTLMIGRKRTGGALAVAALTLLAGCDLFGGGQARYESPDQAGEALLAAVSSGDTSDDAARAWRGRGTGHRLGGSDRGRQHPRRVCRRVRRRTPLGQRDPRRVHASRRRHRVAVPVPARQRRRVVGTSTPRTASRRS